MIRAEENALKLRGSYLFSQVAQHIAARETERPEERVLRLSIGDATHPVPAAAAEEMARAAREMGTGAGLRGYGPEQGYLFLRERIASQDYASLGVEISPEEIFISDGAKSDCAALGELFSQDTAVGVCDPGYPVYVDASVLAGRGGTWDAKAGRWTGLRYLQCSKDNGFLPQPPEEGADLVYLCSPGNPTGAVADRALLQRWVDWANSHGAAIIFDGAYEAFIQHRDIPRSIYQLPGAKSCAIEVRSFSKTASFTGVRCGYTVVPRQLVRSGVSLRALWQRRKATTSNGVSYIVQRGAAALYSPEGRRQLEEHIRDHLENAQLALDRLRRAGMHCWGGTDSPYLWLETPGHMGSWRYFQTLLDRAAVAVVPGAGFGPGGEGYVRLSAFGTRQDTAEAVERICALEIDG